MCGSFAAELDSSIAVIEATNGTVFDGGSWSFRAAPGGVRLGQTEAMLVGLDVVGRFDVASLQVAATAFGVSIEALIDAVAAARRDVPWNAVVEAEGLPTDGTWVSVGTLQATYGTTQEEGGWFLVNMIHDQVADYIRGSRH